MPKKITKICFKEGDVIPPILKKKGIKVFPAISLLKPEPEKKVSEKKVSEKKEPKKKVSKKETKPKKEKINIMDYELQGYVYEDAIYIQTLKRLWSKLGDIQFNKMKDVNDFSKFADPKMNKELQIAFSNPRKLNTEERKLWNNKQRLDGNISEFVQEEFDDKWEKFVKIEVAKPSKGMFKTLPDIGKAFYKYISVNTSKKMDIDYKRLPASAKKIVEKEPVLKEPKEPKDPNKKTRKRRRTKKEVELDALNKERAKRGDYLITEEQMIRGYYNHYDLSDDTTEMIDELKYEFDDKKEKPYLFDIFKYDPIEGTYNGGRTRRIKISEITAKTENHGNAREPIMNANFVNLNEGMVGRNLSFYHTIMDTNIPTKIWVRDNIRLTI